MGYYTLTHAVTGATMLGSTAVGSSAAGTVGIIAGTGTGAGAVAAAIMSTAGIAIGVVLAAGVAGTEGYCYFQDERITEYDEVLKLLESLAANADPNYFKLDQPQTPFQKQASLFVGDGSGDGATYRVENLYVVNGTLKHRDRLRNTTIGNIGLRIVNPEE